MIRKALTLGALVVALTCAEPCFSQGQDQSQTGQYHKIQIVQAQDQKEREVLQKITQPKYSSFDYSFENLFLNVYINQESEILKKPFGDFVYKVFRDISHKLADGVTYQFVSKGSFEKQYGQTDAALSPDGNVVYIKMNDEKGIKVGDAMLAAVGALSTRLGSGDFLGYRRNLAKAAARQVVGETASNMNSDLSMDETDYPRLLRRSY